MSGWLQLHQTQARPSRHRQQEQAPVPVWPLLVSDRPRTAMRQAASILLVQVVHSQVQTGKDWLNTCHADTKLSSWHDATIRSVHLPFHCFFGRDIECRTGCCGSMITAEPHCFQSRDYTFICHNASVHGCSHLQRRHRQQSRARAMHRINVSIVSHLCCANYGWLRR